jgi:hypothetical protein
MGASCLRWGMFVGEVAARCWRAWGVVCRVGRRLRQIRSSKVSRVECLADGRNRNTFAIHGSGVPFPDVLSGNCCVSAGY